jgi:hypothetical protein
MRYMQVWFSLFWRKKRKMINASSSEQKKNQFYPFLQVCKNHTKEETHDQKYDFADVGR